MRDLANDPDLRPLWDAVHARLCRGDLGPTSSLRLAPVTPEQRRAVDRLLGKVSAGKHLTVRLAELDGALARAGTDAATVAAAVCGPVRDRRAEKAAARDRKDGAWERIEAHPTAGAAPVASWIAEQRRLGRLDNVGGELAYLAALDVLGAIGDRDEPLGRAVFAAGALGDEHALDYGTAVERLVTAGLAAIEGVQVPRFASGRAELWARYGVSFDAVSAPVLTLGLRPAPVGPITEAAARWADSGVALPVTAAALAAEVFSVPAGTIVSVCENPSVIEAASARFGASCPPLLCVSGTVSRAGGALLGQLARSGVRLRYHGDFGTGGVAIANYVTGSFGADPWQFSTDDHHRARACLAETGREPRALRGTVPDAVWDPELAAAIQSYGREITEEHVIDDLLDDLDVIRRPAADG